MSDPSFERFNAFLIDLETKGVLTRMEADTLLADFSSYGIIDLKKLDSISAKNVKEALIENWENFLKSC